MRSLRHCLLDTDPVVLRVIAQRWAIDTPAAKARELAEQIETTLSVPAHAAAVIRALPQPEQEALRALLSAGGTLPVANFTQRFGSIRSVGPARLEREQLWRAPISPAENLWYWGLLYRGFEQLPSGAMREVFFAPVELQPLLPLFAVPDRASSPLEIFAAPTDVASSGEALADDVCTLLSHLHNNFVRVPGTALRSVVDPLQRALSVQWRDPQTERLEFLLHLAARAQLIKIAGQRLRPDPKYSTDWLRAPGLDELRALFEAWRADPAWSDVQHTSRLQVERAVSLRSDAVAVRAALLAGLRSAVPGAWHTVESLLARVKAESPDFLRTDFDTDYIRDTTTGEYVRGAAHWEQVEGAVLRSMLTGALCWLGLIDLGDEASVFLLTARGATLLGLAQDAIEPAEIDRGFTVRADATIHVSASRRYDRFQLARVADLIAVVKDEYRYRLTPSSLTRANSQKISIEKVLDFLTSTSDQTVPPGLSKAIQRWAAKGTEVKVQRAVIVQVKDAAILKRLQESPKTRGIPIEVLGSTAARINEKDWPKLVAILAEAGVLVD